VASSIVQPNTLPPKQMDDTLIPDLPKVRNCMMRAIVIELGARGG
jgi:hypothetical protein